MNKLRVIDLLNKIANGEEVPKKIKVYEEIFRYVDKWQQYVSESDERPLLYIMSAFNYSGLDDEVEIIEEDKKIDKIDIEPLDLRDDLQCQIEVVHYENVMIANAVNEIIDKINKGE